MIKHNMSSLHTSFYESIVHTATDPLELAAIHRGRDTGMSKSESVFMFRLRAFHAEIIDDDRCITDFDLLNLQFWVHRDTPITRMTVAEISDTVFGLEWLLTSDIYVVNERTEAWFRQFEDAMHLALHRVYYIIQYETSVRVLDDAKYIERMDAHEKPPAVFDYDSDEETRISSRPVLAKDIETMIEYPHRVTDEFVCDMNTAFRAMDEALFVRWKLGEVPVAPKPDMRELRNHVFREFAEVREQTAVNFRREWIQKLLVTPSYVSVHIRWNPHDIRPTSRSVLVKKRDELAYISVPGSIMDIITPPPKTEGVRGMVDMRMNTDAVVCYQSASVSNQDFVSKLLLGNLSVDFVCGPPPTEVKIGRLLAEQKWILFSGTGQKWKVDSLAAALVVWVSLGGEGGDALSKTIKKRLLGRREEEE